MCRNFATSNRSVEQSIERLPARVLKHQRQAVVIAGQRDWPGRPSRIKFGFKRIFMLEPFERPGGGIVGRDDQDR